MAAPQHVVLLRAVNVGGTAKLPMADLRRHLEALGCTEARTYIQSGNAVVRAPARVAARLAERLADRIEEAHGFRRPVIVRSEAELRAVHAAQPFDDEDPKKLHVAFLSAAPEAGRALDPARSPGDAFALVGAELYLHMPNGMGRTKLDNAYIERQLGVTSTVRNWRTVTTLLEMLG
ncbi:MAG: DUF1697 domain-containing protein [Sandaracinaceae bacterium]|nr:DUF1697 domain-containing protein [Sandaracinaceae bacterium]